MIFGEIHGNKQEYEWLTSLIATPESADRVDDIVMEFGNSLYQKSVDRYVAGEDVPVEQVEKAWRNYCGSDRATIAFIRMDLLRPEKLLQRLSDKEEPDQTVCPITRSLQGRAGR